MPTGNSKDIVVLGTMFIYWQWQCQILVFITVLILVIICAVGLTMEICNIVGYKFGLN